MPSRCMALGLTCCDGPGNHRQATLLSRPALVETLTPLSDLMAEDTFPRPRMCRVRGAQSHRQDTH